MRKFILLFATILLAAGAAPAAPQHEGHGDPAAQAKTARKGSAKPRTGRVRTVTGFVSDSHCGLKHMEGMGDEAACTLKCVEGGGKFVLADRARKVVYNLGREGQEKAREFAGRQVRVTGRVTGRTIHVTRIEAAS